MYVVEVIRGITRKGIFCVTSLAFIFTVRLIHKPAKHKSFTLFVAYAFLSMDHLTFQHTFTVALPKHSLAVTQTINYAPVQKEARHLPLLLNAHSATQMARRTSLTEHNKQLAR